MLYAVVKWGSRKEVNPLLNVPSCLLIDNDMLYGSNGGAEVNEAPI